MLTREEKRTTIEGTKKGLRRFFRGCWKQEVGRKRILWNIKHSAKQTYFEGLFVLTSTYSICTQNDSTIQKCFFLTMIIICETVARRQHK